jgi:hypothetical protein
MRDSAASKGVRLWRTAAAERRRERELLTRAMQRMTGGKLLQAVLRWQASAAAALLARAAERHYAGALARRSFAAWARFLAARRAWRERGYAADAHVNRLRLRRAAKTWAAEARLERRCRSLLRRALANMLMRGVMRAFESWAALRASPGRLAAGVVGLVLTSGAMSGRAKTSAEEAARAM